MKQAYKIVFAAWLLGLVAVNSFGQSMDYGNNAKAGRYYAVNGIKLYCEQYGTGEALVLLHGNGDNMGAWRKNIAYLSKKFRVIAVDSRAHGKSVDAGDSLSFEMMAHDVAVLLDTLQIDSAYVAGWSDGGIVALVMAMNFPTKVKKLVATGANIFADSTAFANGLWQEMEQGYTENKDSIFSDPKKKNAWKVFLLDVFQPRLAFDDLKAVRCPALIMAGDRDVIAIAHTVGIFQHIAGAQLWIVPNSGHATLQEHADLFNKVVSDFFLSKDAVRKK